MSIAIHAVLNNPLYRSTLYLTFFPPTLSGSFIYLKLFVSSIDFSNNFLHSSQILSSSFLFTGWTVILNFNFSLYCSYIKTAVSSTLSNSVIFSHSTFPSSATIFSLLEVQEILNILPSTFLTKERFFVTLSDDLLLPR